MLPKHLKSLELMYSVSPTHLYWQPIYVVVIVDCFLRWTEFVLVTDITATTVADAVVEHIVLQLRSDHGSHFLSRLFQWTADRLGVKKFLRVRTILRQMVKWNASTATLLPP